MKTDPDQRESRGNPLAKWGPLAVIVVLLLAVGAFVVAGNRGGDDDSGDDAGSGSDTGELAEGAPEPTGRMPLTYAEAQDGGTVDDYDWGDRCDTDSAKVRIPTVYAMPCVPVFDGDNGGATTGGVTADTIRIVRYVPQANDAAASFGPLAAAADDSQDEQHQTMQDYFDIYSSQAELYGRQIELIDYPATGAATDVVAARADGRQIAEELEPFAVLGGPGLDEGAFAQELTAHDIVCLDCAGALPADMLKDMEPLVWSALPSGEQILTTMGAWTTRLGETATAEENVAQWAGGPQQDKPRKFGVIHFDQDPPIFAVDEDDIPEGIDLVDSYLLDPTTIPQRTQELVARFKSQGITTVAFFGDPYTLTFLTQAATEQGWFPEWVITGTAFTDTIAFGRGYDPQQVAHAFGISQTAATTPQDLQDGVQLYRWYFGGDDTMPPASTLYTVLSYPAQFIVQGIHMAGPDLTPETFARGQFRVPPAGGGPTRAQVSFGNWGFFPGLGTDYAAIDDDSEIWWDPTVEAPDEIGTPGTGVWRRAHGGERFINAEDVPAPDPFGDPADTVTVVDPLPAEDAAPAYPPPPGSPAVG
jgi:hypothetical protein